LSDNKGRCEVPSVTNIWKASVETRGGRQRRREVTGSEKHRWGEPGRKLETGDRTRPVLMVIVSLPLPLCTVEVYYTTS
jgi:hypothetical protein